MDTKLQLTIFFFAVAIPVLLLPLIAQQYRSAAGVRLGIVFALSAVSFALSAYLGLHWRGSLSSIVAAQCNDRSLFLLAVAGGLVNVWGLYEAWRTIRRSRALSSG